MTQPSVVTVTLTMQEVEGCIAHVDNIPGIRQKVEAICSDSERRVQIGCLMMDRRSDLPSQYMLTEYIAEVFGSLNSFVKSLNGKVESPADEMDAAAAKFILFVCGLASSFELDGEVDGEE